MSSLHVLLFDEETLLRRATALMLGARGANVPMASSVDELVALTKKRIYDIAVLDLPVDGPTGEEIVARIRGAGLVPRRIVVCAPAQLDRREGDVFTQVLLKPYPFQQLLAAVFGPASRRRPTRSGVFSRARGGVPRIASVPGGGNLDVASLARRQVARNENGHPRRALRVIAGGSGRTERGTGGRVRELSPRPPRRAARVRRGRG